MQTFEAQEPAARRLPAPRPEGVGGPLQRGRNAVHRPGAYDLPARPPGGRGTDSGAVTNAPVGGGGGAGEEGEGVVSSTRRTARMSAPRPSVPSPGRVAWGLSMRGSEAEP